MSSEEKTRQRLVDAVRKADNEISGSLEIQVNELINNIFPALQKDSEQLQATINVLNIVFYSIAISFDEYDFKNKNKERLKKDLVNAITERYGDQPNALEQFFEDIRDKRLQLTDKNPFMTCKIPASGVLAQVGIDKIQEVFNNLDEAVADVLNHHDVTKLSEVDNEHTKNIVRRNIINSLVNAIKNGHYDIAFNSKAFSAIKDMSPFEKIAPKILEDMANGGGDKLIGLLQDKEFVKILENLDVANIYPIAHFIAYLPSLEGRGDDGVRFRYTPHGFSREQEDIIFKQLLGNEKIKSTLLEWIKSPRQNNEGMETDGEGFYVDDGGYHTRIKLKDVISEFEKSQQCKLDPKPNTISAIENKSHITYTQTFVERKNHRIPPHSGWGKENN